MPCPICDTEMLSLDFGPGQTWPIYFCGHCEVELMDEREQGELMHTLGL